MPILGGGFAVGFAALMAWHAVNTGRAQQWLFIIVIAPIIGPTIYLLVNVLPDVMGGSRVRRMHAAAQKALDPTKEYRQAKTECDDSPTAGNLMRLARAAAALGQHGEAETLFRQATVGIHADDPALMLGRAQSLVELGRHQEALDLLVALGDQGEKGRTPQAALAMGRAYHALGRFSEADTAYDWAANHLPGLEGMARYAVFLADTGQRDRAHDLIRDMDKRVTKISPHFRKEARTWRDFAAKTLEPTT
jgi:hypothetical protein